MPLGLVPAIGLVQTIPSSQRTSISGEAPAIETYFGILVTSLEQLEVECLPRDLPERIDVDVTNMKEIGDAVHVRDLVLSQGVEVLDDPDTIIVLITPPVSEAAREAEEAGLITSAEPEVIERGKREEEAEE